MTTAQTILAQLGGSRFVAMTGAKDLLNGGNSLMFRIGRGAKNKANKVRVTLTDRDDYTVEFFNQRGLDLKVISERSMVYADNLREVFTAETGMYCSL